MSFGDAVASVIHNFDNFSGRARRSEYWYWTLFTVIIDYILSRIFGNSSFGGLVTGIVSLIFLVLNLSVSVRRMHDIGRSGFWLFLHLIPGIGSIILFIMRLQDSQGDNRFGPSPKYPNIEY